MGRSCNTRIFKHHPLPAKIYANEGAAQFLFFKGENICELSYADRKGKYMFQKGITLPKL